MQFLDSEEGQVNFPRSWIDFYLDPKQLDEHLDALRSGERSNPSALTLVDLFASKAERAASSVSGAVASDATGGTEATPSPAPVVDTKDRIKRVGEFRQFCALVVVRGKVPLTSLESSVSMERQWLILNAVSEYQPEHKFLFYRWLFRSISRDQSYVQNLFAGYQMRQEWPPRPPPPPPPTSAKSGPADALQSSSGDGSFSLSDINAETFQRALDHAVQTTAHLLIQDSGSGGGGADSSVAFVELAEFYLFFSQIKACQETLQRIRSDAMIIKLKEALNEKDSKAIFDKVRSLEEACEADVDEHMESTLISNLSSQAILEHSSSSPSLSSVSSVSSIRSDVLDRAYICSSDGIWLPDFLLMLINESKRVPSTVSTSNVPATTAVSLRRQIAERFKAEDNPRILDQAAAVYTALLDPEISSPSASSLASSSNFAASKPPPSDEKLFISSSHSLSHDQLCSLWDSQVASAEPAPSNDEPHSIGARRIPFLLSEIISLRIYDLLDANGLDEEGLSLARNLLISTVGGEVGSHWVFPALNIVGAIVALFSQASELMQNSSAGIVDSALPVPAILHKGGAGPGEEPQALPWHHACGIFLPLLNGGHFSLCGRLLLREPIPVAEPRLQRLFRAYLLLVEPSSALLVASNNDAFSASLANALLENTLVFADHGSSFVGSALLGSLRNTRLLARLTGFFLLFARNQMQWAEAPSAAASFEQLLLRWSEDAVLGAIIAQSMLYKWVQPADSSFQWPLDYVFVQAAQASLEAWMRCSPAHTDAKSHCAALVIQAECLAAQNRLPGALSALSSAATLVVVTSQSLDSNPIASSNDTAASRGDFPAPVDAGGGPSSSSSRTSPSTSPTPMSSGSGSEPASALLSTPPRLWLQSMFTRSGLDLFISTLMRGRAVIQAVVLCQFVEPRNSGRLLALQLLTAANPLTDFSLTCVGFLFDVPILEHLVQLGTAVSYRQLIQAAVEQIQSPDVSDFNQQPLINSVIVARLTAFVTYLFEEYKQ